MWSDDDMPILTVGSSYLYNMLQLGNNFHPKALLLISQCSYKAYIY